MASNRGNSIYYSFYRFAINIGASLYNSTLKKRIANGKEDRERFWERMAITQFARPLLQGDNGKLIWFHGASVGETKIGIDLARQIRANNDNVKFLFTSQTKTAADIISKNICTGDVHQYFPLDKLEYVKKFLNHWKPDVAVFLEGEIWPNMLMELQGRNIPVALINARMTAKSIRTWLRYNKFACQLFGTFDFIHAANEITAQAVSEFGFDGDVPVGNFKNAAPKPPIDNMLIDDLKHFIKDRQTWLAASTHNGEDEIVLKAHEIIKIASHSPDTKSPLLILAPRHTERTEGIILQAQKYGFKIARRSLKQAPDENIDIYIWDTMGELGNAMSVCNISLICGSLIPDIGGHNPVEPAQLHSAILSGKYVHNFQDVYIDMENANAAIIIDNTDINNGANNVAINVSSLLYDDAKRNTMIKNAANYVDKAKQNTDATVALFSKWLKEKIS